MEQSDKIVISKLKKIAVISLCFMTIEIVGGALASSIAIMADAFHLFSDVIAYVISLYAVLLSKKMAPKYLSFGYEKAQPLGALINVAIIWCVTVELFIEATHRIMSKQVVKEPLFMLLTSIFGLGCNLYIMKILHSSEGGHCGHNHSHGQSHEHSHGQSHGPSSRNYQLPLNQESVEQKNNTQDQEYIEAICSCNSPDEMNRTTKISMSLNDYDSKELDSPFPVRLSEGLVQKSKGYCLVHSHESNEKKSNHAHSHDHHDHSHGHNGCSHNHGNQQSHDHQSHHSKAFENINIQAAYIHIISDIILSIGVIVSASVIYFVAGNDSEWTAWQLADPFCTYLFSIVALYSTISIIKESMLILMDGCENKGLINETHTFIKQLKNKNVGLQVQGVKVWSSNRGKHYCAMKVILKKEILLTELNQQHAVLKQTDNQQLIYDRIVSFCKDKKMTCYIDVSRK